MYIVMKSSRRQREKQMCSVEQKKKGKKKGESVKHKKRGCASRLQRRRERNSTDGKKTRQAKLRNITYHPELPQVERRESTKGLE